MANFWDEKFSGEEYLYGLKPNDFLKSSLEGLKPEDLLIPGEGEGRNSVYAASLGWNVHAFDSSTRGREKALKLAEKKGLDLNYELSDYASFQSTKKYDAIALIFTHMPSEIRAQVHNKYVDLLKSGGRLILQTFSKKQLGLKTGGPKDIDLLFSAEELKNDFNELEEFKVNEVYEELDEGPLHSGMAQLICAIGRK